MGEPARTLLLGTEHDDTIHDMQLDFYGQLLATCSSDHTVKIFAPTPPAGSPGQGPPPPPGQAPPYQLVQTLKGHEGPVWAIGWAHPKFGGHHLASCSADHKVIVWKETSSRHWVKHHEHRKHNASVNGLAWGPPEAGLCLAAASSDGAVSILVWVADHWADHRIDAHQGGCTAVSWAPHLPAGALLSLPQGKAPAPAPRRIVTAGVDHLVKIWRFMDTAGTLGATSWDLEATLQEHTDWVRDVEWAGNIGLPFSHIASCGQDGRVVVWAQRSEGEEWTRDVILHVDAPQWSVSWSELGNLLAVCGAPNEATLWRQSPKDGRWRRVADVTPAEGTGG